MGLLLHLGVMFYVPLICTADVALVVTPYPTIALTSFGDRCLWMIQQVVSISVAAQHFKVELYL